METKEERRVRRLEERKAKRGPTKEELLKKEGKRFVNFVVPIVPFELWANFITSQGGKPNERLWELIVKDMKGEL